MENDAYALALNLLTGRRLTTEEVRQRLQRRGVGRVECEEVLERLQASGLLDDVSYAKDMVQDALAYGKHGPIGVRAKLYRRGIHSATIAQILPDDAAVWEAVALRLLQEYDIEDEKARERLLRRLVREGFPSPIIRQMVKAPDRHDSA